MGEQISKKRGNPSWVKGTSGNPAGRRPNALSFAERVREKVDPDTLIERALQVVRGEDDDAAMKAAAFLADRGWSRPPAEHRVEAVTTARELDFGHLSPEQLRTEIQRVRGLLTAPPTTESDD